MSYIHQRPFSIKNFKLFSNFTEILQILEKISNANLDLHFFSIFNFLRCKHKDFQLKFWEKKTGKWSIQNSTFSCIASLLQKFQIFKNKSRKLKDLYPSRLHHIQIQLNFTKQVGKWFNPFISWKAICFVYF